MNRLLAIVGGQPLRSDDWAFIQDATVETIKALVEGLNGSTGACIVTGLEVTYEGDVVYVTEGVVFDGDEPCYVPSFSHEVVEGHLLYLTLNYTTDEQRTFKDTTTHNVYGYNRYLTGYAASVPSGSIAIASLSNIRDSIKDYVISAVLDAKTMIAQASLTYLTGFTPATNYGSPVINANSLGDVMLIAAFYATSAAGKICTIPSGLRPAGDLGAFFIAGSSIGLLKIKENGEVWVENASTASVNYISFQFSKLFNDLVNYNIPTDTGFLPD